MPQVYTETLDMQVPGAVRDFGRMKTGALASAREKCLTQRRKDAKAERRLVDRSSWADPTLRLPFPEP